MAASHHYLFEWAPAKASSNLKKHGVSFERAATVFRDPLSLTIYDAAHSEDEDRWVVMGMDRHEILLVVVHTVTDINNVTTKIRLISARKATTNETRQYHDS